MWISSKTLRWPSYSESNLVLNGDKRPYDLLHHAEELLEINTSSFYRTDAIFSLKRAIDNRVYSLQNLYKLKEIPINNFPKKPIDQLTSLGVIRPYMLEELRNIRNSIEHEDTSPPSYKECLGYIDLVWYFLKSTDSLVFFLHDTWLLTPDIFHDQDENHQFLEVFLNVESNHENLIDWNFNIRARLNKDNVSEQKKENWIEISFDNESCIEENDTIFLRNCKLLNDSDIQKFIKIYFGLM